MIKFLCLFFFIVGCQYSTIIYTAQLKRDKPSYIALNRKSKTYYYYSRQNLSVHSGCYNYLNDSMIVLKPIIDSFNNMALLDIRFDKKNDIDTQKINLIIRHHILPNTSNEVFKIGEKAEIQFFTTVYLELSNGTIQKTRLQDIQINYTKNIIEVCGWISQPSDTPLTISFAPDEVYSWSLQTVEEAALATKTKKGNIKILDTIETPVLRTKQYNIDFAETNNIAVDMLFVNMNAFNFIGSTYSPFLDTIKLFNNGTAQYNNILYEQSNLSSKQYFSNSLNIKTKPPKTHVQDIKSIRKLYKKYKQPIN
jgi:hypothetical protein